MKVKVEKKTMEAPYRVEHYEYDKDGKVIYYYKEIKVDD